MPAPRPADLPPTQTLAVVAGHDLVVTYGAARGDGLGIADDLVLDDVYQLRPGAARLDLLVETAPGGAAGEGSGAALRVAEGSGAGTAGHAVHLDCCLTLMQPDGRTVELLVLVEVEGGAIAEVWGLPLAALRAQEDLRLVGLDRHAATARLAQAASASFARGTRITMASGAQVPVEDLVVGDRLLTRDEGPQPIRWIGHRTLRATGAFAPVVIRQGALHNEGDLVLSPDHRILVYQRQDRLGAGRAEVMVKVRHLVNGTSVVRREGGFVEYFQLLLDDHQIVFAEGIAAESLLVDPRTRAALPEGTLPGGLGAHAPRRHQAYEVQAQLLSGPDAVALLRRASG